MFCDLFVFFPAINCFFFFAFFSAMNCAPCLPWIVVFLVLLFLLRIVCCVFYYEICFPWYDLCSRCFFLLWIVFSLCLFSNMICGLEHQKSAKKYHKTEERHCFRGRNAKTDRRPGPPLPRESLRSESPCFRRHCIPKNVISICWTPQQVLLEVGHPNTYMQWLHCLIAYVPGSQVW